MHFTFRLPNHETENPNAVYYYNGETNIIKTVHNLEEWRYLREIYKETYGYDLVHYIWDQKVAPVNIRIFGVLQPIPYSETERTIIKELQESIAEYIKAFADPDWFIAQMIVPIRTEPNKISEVLGYSYVNQRFNLSDMVFACDWYWGVIDYKGKKAYIPMGDISGDEYGIREKRNIRVPAVSEVIGWLQSLIDFSASSAWKGYYEEQQVDLTNWLLGNFFSQPIFGEYDTLIETAELMGYKALKTSQTSSFKQGDIVLYRDASSNKYKTGFVYSVTDTSLEVIYQEMSVSETSTLGSKVLKKNLPNSTEEIVGYVRPPYAGEVNPKVPTAPIIPPKYTTPSSTSGTGFKKLNDKHGGMTVRVAGLNVRAQPTTKSAIVASYSYGQYLNFDSMYVGDGYIWLSYIASASKIRRYVAAGEAKGNNIVVPYGIIQYT